jgi:hypothetical protein
MRERSDDLWLLDGRPELLAAAAAVLRRERHVRSVDGHAARQRAERLRVPVSEPRATCSVIDAARSRANRDLEVILT